MRDLHDILNDRRERNGDNIPAPAQRPEAVPKEVQAQLDNLKKELEKLSGGKPSFNDQDRRKGTSFSLEFLLLRYLASSRCRYCLITLGRKTQFPMSTSSRFRWTS